MSLSPERSAVRRIVPGILRLSAGLLVLIALVTQVTDQLLNDAFVPSEYFSYFTIQSGLIEAVTLLVGGVMCIRLPADTVLFTVVRMSSVAYAVITAGVYNGLLRGLPKEGFVGVQWPNEVLHVWIPIIIVLDWLLTPGGPALSWTGLRYVVLYPIAWLVFTLVRGAATGWYPYPFLEPSSGILSVASYIIGIAVFIVGVASLAITYSRRRAAP